MQASGRNIVLLSDGTGNAAGKLFKTNVWRTYQALDLSSTHQIAYYDDGVGTSSVKPVAILGGAFGWGLKRNVLALYTFLCRNYQPATEDRRADQIYGFGFSRGAFTMRVLVKFVLSKGLITNFNSNDDLHRKALWLYRAFRSDNNTRFRVEVPARAARDLLLWPFRPDPSEVVQVPGIRFLGLWDTVDAYGLPVEELKKGIDRYLWPLALEDRALDDRIEKACHALAIDDKRTTFHPLLWDESDRDAHPARDRTGAERLTQVWFTGAHANVGGGYPDDGLSYVPLRWMIRQAQAHGLAFNPIAVEEIAAGFAPFGKLYNSRAGLGAYYRYGPRRLDPPRDKQGACIPHPKIHETVLWRMAAGTDAYAPLSLPNDLRIVVDPPAGPKDGAGRAESATKREAASPDIVSFEDYQAQASAQQFALTADRDPDHQRRTAWQTFVLEKPDDKTLGLIWDTVWWRRVTYFATLAATALLVAYPFLPEAGTIAPLRLRELAESIAPLTNGAVDIIGGFLPDFAKSWLNAFKTNPWAVSFLIASLVTCIAWGSLTDRRIHDRALAAWNKDWRKRRADWFQSRLRQRNVFNIVLLLVSVVTGLGAYYTAQNPDLSGCTPPPSGESDFGYGLCVALTGLGNLIFYGLVAIVAGVIAVANIIWSIMLRRFAKEAQAEREEKPGFALRLARRARESTVWGATQRWLGSKGIPAMFALGVVVLVLYGANWLAFTMAQSGGLVCQAGRARTLPYEPVTATILSRELCNSTGIYLQDKRKYRITFEGGDDWRDPVSPRDWLVGAWGFETRATEAPQLLLMLPMRRVIGANWFAVVLKLGSSGDEQYVMTGDSIVIEPRRGGALYAFVNDAVIGLPFLADLFYRGNLDKATLKIEEIGKPE